MVDDRNNACGHSKLAADPETDAGGHADGFGVLHQSLDVFNRERAVGSSTSALLAVVGVFGADIVHVEVAFHGLVEVSKPLSQLCQVFHTGREEFGLVVHDACGVEHVEEFLDAFIGEVGHDDGLHQG